MKWFLMIAIPAAVAAALFLLMGCSDSFIPNDMPAAPHSGDRHDDC